MKRETAFDKWYRSHFKHYPKGWQTHAAGDTYSLRLVKLAFEAGRRYRNGKK